MRRKKERSKQGQTNKQGKATQTHVCGMDLIPILLGSLPLAHNAQHSLVIMFDHDDVAFNQFQRSNGFAVSASKFCEYHIYTCDV